MDIEEVEGPRKKRRIALACTPCRERKRKCNGVKPVCGACSGRTGSTSCTWDDERLNRGWTNSYVNGLESRVAVLEEQLRQSNVRTPSSSALSPHVQNRAAPTCSRDSGGDDGLTGLRADQESEDLEETGLDGMGVLSTTSDIKPRQPGQAKYYYGPSSSASLLDKARHAMASRRSNDRGEPQSIQQSSTQKNHTPSTSIDGTQCSVHSSFKVGRGHVVDLIYPSRAQADRLVESYWHSYHSLYPFLHQPSFTARYATIWSSKHDCNATDARLDLYSTLNDRTFYCLLNTIFAMGALFSPELTVHDRNSFSRTFFERANRVLDFELVAQGSVGLVQMLLLVGQYLQTTDNSNFCWIIIGIAIRAAQGIGLHQEPHCCRQVPCERAEHSQLDIQMRRRTWTGCVLLDRHVHANAYSKTPANPTSSILSLTYGRPLMIPPSGGSLTLPAAIDDEFLSYSTTSCGKQPNDIQNSIECYIQAIKLQDILARLVATLNTEQSTEAVGTRRSSLIQDNSSNGTKRAATQLEDQNVQPPDLQSFLIVEQALDVWHDGIPVHLCADTYAGLPAPTVEEAMSRVTMFRRQANILESRYLLIRMTMLRPALCALSDIVRTKATSSEHSSMSSSMQHAMLRLHVEHHADIGYRQAANACVAVANEQMTLLTSNASSPVDIVAAPWYNVLYIHSAAIVLLLGYLCGPTHITCMDAHSISNGFDRCLEFLKSLESNNRSARRCLRVLELARQEILGHLKVNSQEDGRPSSPEQSNVNASAQFFMPTPSRNSAQQLGDSSAEPAVMPSSESLAQDTTWSDGSMSTPVFLGDATQYDQSGLWTGDASDMTWLSFMPFWENDTDYTWPSYQ